MIEFVVLTGIFIPVFLWGCRTAYLRGVNHSVGRYLQGIRRLDTQPTGLVTKRPREGAT